MATKKPTGEQLDIPSIATALTTDVTAISILDAEYARTDNFVDKTTAQTIGGSKTFSNNMVITSATPALTIQSTGTSGLTYLYLRDSDTVQGQLTGLDGRFLIRRPDPASGGTDHTDLDLYGAYINASKVIRAPDPVGSTDLTTKGYVDNTFLKLTGGTLKNTGATTELVIDSEAGQPSIFKMNFEGNGIGQIRAYASQMIMKHNTGASLSFNTSYLYSDMPFRGVDSTIANSFTTRGYVEDTYFPVTGGTLMATTGNTTLSIDTAGADNTYIMFRQDGTTVSQIYNYVSSFNISRPLGTTSFTMYNDYSKFVGNVVCNSDPTDDGHLTRKLYVDDNFLKLAGGDITGQVKITYDNTRIKLNAPAGDPAYELQEDGVRRGLLYWSAAQDRLILGAYNDTGATSTASIQLYDTGYILSTVEHRGLDSTVATSFTTRGYVDDTFLKLSGGTVTGSTVFSGGMYAHSSNAFIGIRSLNASETAGLRFIDDANVINADIYMSASASREVIFRQRTGTTINNTFAIGQNSATVLKDLRCATMGTDDSSVVTLDYINALEARIAALESA